MYMYMYINVLDYTDLFASVHMYVQCVQALVIAIGWRIILC